MSSRMRSTKSKRNMRRSQHGLKIPNFSIDENGTPVVRHRIVLTKNTKKQNEVSKVTNEVKKQEDVPHVDLKK